MWGVRWGPRGRGAGAPLGPLKRRWTALYYVRRGRGAASECVHRDKVGWFPRFLSPGSGLAHRRRKRVAV
eukprot:1088515-Prymnesium_polylepis.1